MYIFNIGMNHFINQHIVVLTIDQAVSGGKWILNKCNWYQFQDPRGVDVDKPREGICAVRPQQILGDGAALQVIGLQREPRA